MDAGGRIEYGCEVITQMRCEGGALQEVDRRADARAIENADERFIR